MKIQEIREAFNSISKSNDYEANHGYEDSLLWDFVHHVADANGQHSRLAKELLKLEEIDQPRWCA